MKDYFSGHSKTYATFRPVYPSSLYDFIFAHISTKNIAWDCATGNGQVAQYLCNHFNTVYATDLSAQQIASAHQAANIHYSAQRAEKTVFKEDTFDLVTVGQALHWFDRSLFYEEVNRVAKKEAVLAVWGYAVLSIESLIDTLLNEFYNGTVGPYWDDARKLVEDEYKSIDFPFKEIKTPRFSIDVSWTLEHLAGYLESWSATQRYIKTKGNNPVPDFISTLQPYWKNGEDKKVTFPVFLRLGKI